MKTYKLLYNQTNVQLACMHDWEYGDGWKQCKKCGFLFIKGE